jgi:hypothetical protein
MDWHEKYTNDEINKLLDKLLDWVSDHLDGWYNSSYASKEDLIKVYLRLGFHEDDVREWYEEV